MWKRIEEGAWLGNRVSKTDGAREAAAAIIDRVDEEGDAALIALAKEFDRVDLGSLAVTIDEIEEAYDAVDPELIEELENAAFRIERFHEMQRPPGLWLSEVSPGVTLGVKNTPLARVGCYVPGGRASYPSTALMCVIAAKVAGVEEVVCCTPPPADPLTLVAMDIAGADEIYKVGGAQAVAAMALGTESIEPVLKIVGPGNAYVTAAKEMLRGVVEIDFPAGPSEIGIIADSTAVPAYVAADVLAQAEHDPSAAAVLVTDDPDLPGKVGAEIKRMLKGQRRKGIIEAALANSGYMVVGSIEEAAAVMDGMAPEHLSIQTADPMSVLSMVNNAGSIFLGPFTPVAAGDYASGTNHVLPTAGNAVVHSGLTVAHFMKSSTVQMITREGLEDLAPTIEAISSAEGLCAHRDSVGVRLRD
ncbi:MAG: histidinol dehydrogenase [Thermoplasmatales archaeon]|nr:histidinol dehydrogenase [Thermoplasmatales archaeon]